MPPEATRDAILNLPFTTVPTSGSALALPVPFVGGGFVELTRAQAPQPLLEAHQRAPRRRRSARREPVAARGPLLRRGAVGARAARVDDRPRSAQRPPRPPRLGAVHRAPVARRRRRDRSAREPRERARRRRRV